MISAWPLTGRGDELRIVRTVIAGDSSCAGIVIAGAPGVGKTRLAREALEQARTRRCRTYWTAGTESSRSVPLGAFTDVVTDFGADPLMRVHDVLTGLVGGPDRPHLVVGVDDAHLLDDMSAFVVHRLVLHGLATVVLTIRAGERWPDALVRCCKNGPLRRLDLRPLSRDDTRTLVETVLEAPMEASSAERLWACTQGNVLYLRHLLEDEYASGRLTQSSGVWLWPGPSGLSPTLLGLVEASIGRQSASVCEVLDVLSTCEPLDLAVLRTVVDPAALDAAEASRLVVVETDSRAPTVRLAHPLIGEVRRAEAGILRLRTIRGRVAAALTATGDTDPRTTVRRTLLTMNSDCQATPATLLEAASAAMQLLDAHLSDQFARAAVAAGGSAAAHLTRAFTLGLLERGQEADHLLSELASTVPDGALRLRIALIRAGNSTWVERAPCKAEEILTATGELAASLDRRSAHRALRSAAAAAGGHCRTAVNLARDAVHDGGIDDYETMMAIWSLVIGLGDVGDVDAVSDVAATGYALAEGSFEAAHLRFGLGLLELTAYLLAGRLADADAVTHRLYEHGLDMPHAVGVNFMLGMCEAAHGRLATAQRHLREAVAQSTGSADNTTPGLLSATLLVATLSMSGKPSEAERILAGVDVRIGPGFAMWDPDIAAAEGWVRAAAGALSEAITTVRRAADVAAEQGRPAREVQCLQIATQFGDATTARRLRQLSTVVSGPRVAAAAAHATALAGRDGDALLEASRAYEVFGDLVAAADAAAHAAANFRRAGRRGPALTACAVARRLADACEGASTPALRAYLEPVPLTGRQREIVELVQRGLSNREIAERLGVSVRTVEGHLYRACRRTGVCSRDELGELLGTHPNR
ncbi:LuxR C-terminal-related transcriptional regulator [Rhodococcus aetherivorans]